MRLTEWEIDNMVEAMEAIDLKRDEFELTAPDDYESDEDSLGELSTNGSIEINIDDSRDLFEDDRYETAGNDYDECDGQPTEYEEWQDLNGGDDWDHGQYDEY